MYYDTKLQKRQTEKHLNRRGLDAPDINLDEIGIIPLVDTHDIDPDLYIVKDTGEVEIRDGQAHVVYSKTRKTSDPENGIDIRRLLKDKVNARRATLILPGFNFTFEGQTHTLQTRSQADMINWTNARISAAENPPDTPMRIRVASDVDVLIPSLKIIALLRAGVDHIKSIMDKSWDLKNDIDNAASDDLAFDLFEAGIDIGWPDNTTPFEVV
ncbi:MAG: hypothetical protein MI862_05330 [Desulfobacterales bacterium]|nr:hypothetical protein [Desulfobacterales bacterium]